MKKDVLLVVSLLGISIGLLTFNHARDGISVPVNNTLPMVKQIDVQYAADFSDDRVLMGASHNVFVGKVIQQTGTKERGIGPETQYQVQIIDNVKGNLSGVVTVDQQGGYKNGVLYVVGGDTVAPAQDGSNYLLQTGSTYLFATRYNSSENWYTLNSYPTASKKLSTNTLLSVNSLKAIAKKDPRFMALQVAYQHEVPLDADVKHNNVLNSYAAIVDAALSNNPQTIQTHSVYATSTSATSTQRF